MQIVESFFVKARVTYPAGMAEREGEGEGSQPSNKSAI